MKRIVHLTGRAVRALGALTAFFILSSAGALSASADLEALGVAVKSGDSLAVKFSSKGAVKVTGKLGGKTVSASAKVVVTEVLEDGKAAAGEVVVPYGARAAVLPFVWSAGQKPEVDESLSE